MKAIVLDRDGVINHDSDDFIRTAEQWVPIPGSIEAIAGLGRGGYRVVVASNQSGVGRGLIDQAALAAMTAKMTALVTAAGGEIAAVAYCLHHPDAGCDCRKPRTGLLRQLEAQLGHSLAGSVLVGDSLRDLQAARAHGCRPTLVRTGKGTRTERELAAAGFGDVAVLADLAAVAATLLRHTP